jgi:ATP-binding cassette subfamily B protein
MPDRIPRNPFKFGLFASRPYLKWALPALFFALLATGLDRFHVVILRNLTNSLTNNPADFSAIWFWALLFPAVHFIGRSLWRSSGFAGMRWFTSFRSYAYQSLYNYLTLHSKDYFNNRFAGALSSKVSNAVEGSRSLFERLLWEFIPIAIGLFSYAVISFMENIILGGILLIWSLIFLSLNFYLALKMKSYSVRFAKSMSVLRGKIVDSLSNISLVHENAFVGGERQYIKKYVDKQTEASLSQWRFSEWVLVINGFMISLFMLLMIASSVYLFQNGLVSIGVIVMVIAMVVDLSQGLFAIGQQIKQAARDYGETKEGLEEILSEHTITDAPGVINFNILKGEISIESVDFDYDNSTVFKNFSLTIPAGQKVGLVGKSGAGKTTFVSLLLRHFEVVNGDIKIDGESISKISLDSLRRGVAFVPQDTSLFHRTISENIGYSNPEATIDDIKNAAKLAEAHDFIMNLPSGYETLVGERGVKLSGGQRQRVAIARAFLKNSPILILDEATSSLDSASEHAIQISLNQLMKNKTVIAIAHRLSTLKKMDRIIFIDQGKIAEDGTPEELLKKPNGLFKKIWDHQVKGFIVE